MAHDHGARLWANLIARFALAGNGESTERAWSKHRSLQEHAGFVAQSRSCSWGAAESYVPAFVSSTSGKQIKSRGKSCSEVGTCEAQAHTESRTDAWTGGRQ